MTQVSFKGRTRSRSLTEGKLYSVIEMRPHGFHIKDDEGKLLHCLKKGCAHLYGGDWEIHKTLADKLKFWKK